MSGGRPTASLVVHHDAGACRRPGDRRDAVAGAARATCRRSATPSTPAPGAWVEHRDQEQRQGPRLRPRRPGRRRGAGRPRRARRRSLADLVVPAGDGRPLPPRRPDGADGVADAGDRAGDDRRCSSTVATSPCTRGSRRSPPTQIAECHDAGLLVNGWTCNDPAAVPPSWPSWGIDGLCTDLPDVMLAALRPSVDPIGVSGGRQVHSRHSDGSKHSDGHGACGMTRRTASGTWWNSRRSISPR